MLDRQQLEAFAAVAETGSFEQAAGLLHLTRGAISQRVKSLETSIARILLLRDRPVVVTPAGEVLLRHVQALRLLESATREELAPGAGAVPKIAIAVNPDSLATWFAHVLWPLLAARSSMIEVVVDDEDCTDERLSKGEVVGCVSTQPNAAPRFASDALGAMRYRCYATAAFQASHFPQGLTLSEALAAPALLFDRKDALHEEYLQRRFGFAVPSFPRHHLPDPATLLQAIVEGAGYGLVPARQAAPLVATGRLVELEPRDAIDVHLFWHRWSDEPAPSRAVTALVIATARAELAPPEGD